MNTRSNKLQHELQKVISAFINEESNRTSLITVTHVEISNDSKYTTVFISVLPRENSDDVIKFLERNIPEMRTYIRDHIRVRNIPFPKFLIDEGEINRQRIEELSKQIKIPNSNN